MRDWVEAMHAMPDTDECVEWPAEYRDGQGYGLVGRGNKAHRLSCTLTYGPSDRFACHTCDNPPCYNPRHLYWGSPRNNVTDRMAARGQYQLTSADEAEIEAAYKGPQHRWRPRTGPTTTELAAHYGVSQGRIMRVIRDSGVDY